VSPPNATRFLQILSQRFLMTRRCIRRRPSSDVLTVSPDGETELERGTIGYAPAGTLSAFRCDGAVGTARPSIKIILLAGVRSTARHADRQTGDSPRATLRGRCHARPNLCRRVSPLHANELGFRASIGTKRATTFGSDVVRTPQHRCDGHCRAMARDTPAAMCCSAWRGNLTPDCVHPWRSR
jgi:hypothetical protein